MNREIRLETENLAQQIKYLSALEGLTVTKVKQLVNENITRQTALGI